METEVRSPHAGDTADESHIRSGDPHEALRYAREAAVRAASLREGGDEYGAVVAELNSQSWLRQFAALNEQLPGGSANQDFPLTKS